MQTNGLLGSLLSPARGGSDAPVPHPPKAAPGKDDGPDAASSGVLAQISDAARSVFAQMRKDGVAAESFDLHLDLRQLGVKVSANGSRSVEGHSLSVDLHVEAQQGTIKTDRGEVSFQKLDVSFSLEETWVKATETTDQPEKPDVKAGLVDGLKKLVDLLDRSNGDPSQVDGLGEILAQIGRALDAMAKRLSDKQGGKPAADEPVQQLEGVQRQETIHLRALHFEATEQGAEAAAA